MAMPTSIPMETDGGTTYTGTISTQIYELTPPGEEKVTNLIRIDQKWGVQLDWTFDGSISSWLNYHWHLSLYFESIGKGPEYDLPVSGPVIVATQDGQSTGTGLSYTRKIEFDPVNIPADRIEPGIYKPAALIQLYDVSDTLPAALCGTFEMPLVTFYKPK